MKIIYLEKNNVSSGGKNVYVGNKYSKVNALTPVQNKKNMV